MQHHDPIKPFDRMLTITTELFFEMEANLFYRTADAPGHRVLDIGSGNGAYLACYKRFYPDTEGVGLELEEHIFRASIERQQQGLSFIHTSYEDYSPAATFDRVLARLVLRHIPDLSHLLDWLKRQTHPKAILHIIDADEDRLHQHPELPLFSKLYLKSRSHFPQTGWLEYKDALRLELEEAGFRLVKMERYQRLANTPEVKKRLYEYMTAVSELLTGGQVPEALRQELADWYNGPDTTYGIHLFGMSWEVPE